MCVSHKLTKLSVYEMISTTLLSVKSEIYSDEIHSFRMDEIFVFDKGKETNGLNLLNRASAEQDTECLPKP